ncbi:MAG: hypothetical protein H6744_21465 [Deltaproteobacteria bacterium]|nr:hypothetical protein [Deltaproteobacteria bacterium]MCB9789253.1 hypothetical protein [Deltaproteobacteria bacterium]
MALLTRSTRLLALGVLLAGLALSTSAMAAEPSRDADDAAIRAVLATAFRAALADKLDDYMATIHPDARDSSTQRTSIERYSWARFVKQAKWYLDSGKPESFEVVKKDGTGEQPRWFIKDREHQDRMPVPVRFMKHEDHWFIYTNSL